ncbi:patatin family protein [Planomicrobium sp. CPCC 101079]|uniref:patatin-like phospholipase family protein n=1 Tax=Planomicrobium sp. CPCC 101079 TaxID=2599618 RepID=UPI0011B6BD40|nr:patatin family protein [Planomicrobium sp. CPCC 101079]TWT16087.1 patatin family protein [Planomicrobium sp. CPCC 101079]
MKSGLVLEGGGMRGVYTGGVLEKFLEERIFVDYVIGVSAGACNAASYISRQTGRNKEVTIGYVHHPDYISMKNLLLRRELFGMNLIFDEIPNKLVPFDYRQYNEATEEFVIGTTDCLTGEAVYFEKSEHAKDVLAIVRASSSLPFMAKPVEFGGRLLMDGGVADPIPIRKALSDGVTKPIVILTRESGYRKKKSSFARVMPTLYRQFPGIVKSMEDRYLRYNETLAFVEKLEAEGEILIIRPANLYKINGFERDAEKLTHLYNQGYKDAEAAMEKVKNFIDNKKNR